MVKRIPIRQLEGSSPPILDYGEVLREVVRRPLNPQAGASIEEMRQSIRVLDAIDAANGDLELEDADYDHLVAKVRAMPWNIIDRRLVQFHDDVLGAREQP